MPGTQPGHARARAAVTAVLIALLGTLCACASGAARAGGRSPAPAASASGPAQPSPTGAASSPAALGGVSGGGAPNIPAVRLGMRFVPGALRLGVGQHFVVIVSRGIAASGSGISGRCTPAAAARFSTAMLSLRCTGGSYMYTTRRAGSTVLSVRVRPSCPAGTSCPDWMAKARLTLTIG